MFKLLFWALVTLLLLLMAVAQIEACGYSLHDVREAITANLQDITLPVAQKEELSWKCHLVQRHMMLKRERIVYKKTVWH